MSNDDLIEIKELCKKRIKANSDGRDIFVYELLQDVNNDTTTVFDTITWSDAKNLFNMMKLNKFLPKGYSFIDNFMYDCFRINLNNIDNILTNYSKNNFDKVKEISSRYGDIINNYDLEYDWFYFDYQMIQDMLHYIIFNDIKIKEEELIVEAQF